LKRVSVSVWDISLCMQILREIAGRACRKTERGSVNLTRRKLPWVGHAA
jgi:hypothetical protein